MTATLTTHDAQTADALRAHLGPTPARYLAYIASLPKSDNARVMAHRCDEMAVCHEALGNEETAQWARGIARLYRCEDTP